MPGQSRPVPIAAVDDAGSVAVSATVANKRTASVINYGAGTNGGIRTVTGSTFVSSTDTQIEGDTTSAGLTLTMPYVHEYTRNQWRIRRSAGANTLTVAARGSDVINGAASIAVTKQVLIYATDNSSWTAIVVEA